MTYSLSGKHIILFWDPSPDLDLISTIVELYKNDGYVNFLTVSAKETAISITTLDPYKDNIKITI